MEQPSSTVLHYMSSMKEVIKVRFKHKVLTCLGACGGESARPRMVWNSAECVSNLERKWPRGMPELAMRVGDEQVTGKRGEFRSSQA
mmetsp:Transcript_95317/g.307653  ORF Transcript_95317/g.307653 Transcript_95317/m.307653 type:complete len:87 (-) Transcript_95317:121-381(-)